MSMSKLLSRPDRNIFILQELPKLGAGITQQLRKAFETSQNKGYFGVHTIPEPGKPKSDEIFGSSVPKVMIIQNYFPDLVPSYFEDFERYTSNSPFILITGEPDAPIPVPGNWLEVFSSLAELGLRQITLFGYEAQTVPLEIWEKFYSGRLDPSSIRTYHVMQEYFSERPQLMQEPVLMIGCVLGAYVELLAVRKQFGFDIVLEHELLNPGFDQQNIAMWKGI